MLYIEECMRLMKEMYAELLDRQKRCRNDNEANKLDARYYERYVAKVDKIGKKYGRVPL